MTEGQQAAPRKLPRRMARSRSQPALPGAHHLAKQTASARFQDVGHGVCQVLLHQDAKALGGLLAARAGGGKGWVRSRGGPRTHGHGQAGQRGAAAPQCPREGRLGGGSRAQAAAAASRPAEAGTPHMPNSRSITSCIAGSTPCSAPSPTCGPAAAGPRGHSRGRGSAGRKASGTAGEPCSAAVLEVCSLPRSPLAGMGDRSAWRGGSVPLTLQAMWRPGSPGKGARHTYDELPTALRASQSTASCSASQARHAVAPACQAAGGSGGSQPGAAARAGLRHPQHGSHAAPLPRPQQPCPERTRSSIAVRCIAVAPARADGTRQRWAIADPVEHGWHCCIAAGRLQLAQAIPHQGAGRVATVALKEGVLWWGSRGKRYGICMSKRCGGQLSSQSAARAAAACLAEGRVRRLGHVPGRVHPLRLHQAGGAIERLQASAASRGRECGRRKGRHARCGASGGVGGSSAGQLFDMLPLLYDE